MIRRILTTICLLWLLLCLSSCVACSSFARFDPQNAVERFDRFAEWLSQSQITGDRNLIGQRSCAKDAYTGEYRAQCSSASGREVIFGGASVKERILKLFASIETVSGKATLRIRLGASVKEYPADEYGRLETELKLNGGGNYIMLCYENFTGTIVLSSAYAE
ncbi:MAG: hypothetical protein KH354_06840 [Clostridiales bacterium]|nr:hypothetical protein [Clostridiales bacterium]